jgi:hypothetical protein
MLRPSTNQRRQHRQVSRGKRQDELGREVRRETRRPVGQRHQRHRDGNEDADALRISRGLSRNGRFGESGAGRGSRERRGEIDVMVAGIG